MREDTLLENRTKQYKLPDQNHLAKGSSKVSGNPLKPKSSTSWGSQIVRGFTSDKKSKLQSTISNNKKQPICAELPKQKSQGVPQQSRVKRSLIGDYTCSANVAQVHPHIHDCQGTRSPASHDLFHELDHLRILLHEAKERERTLQAEILQYKDNFNVKELEREMDIKRRENEKLVYKVGALEAEKSTIAEQLSSLLNHQDHASKHDSEGTRSPASHDLFHELDHLRILLHEAKERERTLQAEILQYKDNFNVKELEREMDIKRRENEKLVYKVGALEAEKSTIAEQLSSLLNHQDHASKHDSEGAKLLHQGIAGKTSQKNLEMEVVELRRLNKELQFHKRNLALRLSSAESQLATLKKLCESDVVAKAEAEARVLRHTNEDLCKQVEGLQMSRLNEVEELAYLRWINSCLRQELQNSGNRSKNTTPVAAEKISLQEFQNSGRIMTGKMLSQSMSFYPRKSISVELNNSSGVNSGKKITVWPKIDEDCQVLDCEDILDRDWLEASGGRSPGRRHSISGLKGCTEVFELNKRRQSDGFICPRDLEIDGTVSEKCPTTKGRLQMLAQKYDFGAIQSPRFFVNRTETNKLSSLDVEKRALRIPNPPPRPSNFSPVAKRNEPGTSAAPPPPPPPPLPKFSSRSTTLMQRAPQVVELYHSLMKRDSRKEASSGGVGDAPNVANVRSSMIGEIENRSSYLLAIKADVETQGGFVRSLIKEVNGAVYRDIEDVVAFVKWLDDELSFLVDERAVLKHFDWPEKKADTLREAAFGYRDLKKLETEVTHHQDDPHLPCDVALKKMVALSEKMEHSVYNLMRSRDGLMRHCKDFRIPTDWMLDTGIVSKIKFASVKLAKKYMKRVASELHALEASDKDPTLEYMLLQGVRFAFRIHQFAGGFDSETMHAFEELRNLALVRNKT